MLMYADVKMDTKTKNFGYLDLHTWTKFLLKVEPIRIFPCHLRITMMNQNAEISTNMTFRINIPGVKVQMASSRKKQHICSLSWTYNQRCTIFLSFDSQMACESNVTWLRTAIKDLEQYSQELIATKRLSRNAEVVNEESLQMYENIWETRAMKSYEDTRVSGIYEEIPEANCRRNRAPRGSVASGIYEEMLPVTQKSVKTEDMPPPLPPRTRINTGESEIHRSFSNPESDALKKKRYRNMFGSVFGLGRGKSAKSERKGKKCESPVSLSAKFLTLDITQGKRNSFSSPNLTKFTRSVSESDAFSYPTGGSLSDDVWCHESYLNTVSSQPETKTPLEEFDGKESGMASYGNLLEVPQVPRVPTPTITPPSSQESLPENTTEEAFNGIHFKFQEGTLKDDIPTATNTEGYLVMGPVGFNRDKVRELDRLEAERSAEKNLSGYVEMNGNGFNHEAVRELDRLESLSQPSSQEYENCRDLVSNVTFDRGCDSPADPSLIMSQEEKQKLHEEVLRDLNQSPKALPRRSMDFDEKVPSFFHNDDFCLRRSGKSQMRENKRRHQESPEVTRQTASFNGDVQVAKRRPTTAKKVDSPQEISAENRLNVPEIAEKCATLSRISRCSLRADLTSGFRRFASLPRFRKLDFTPLKAKITSALQRQNT
ncbi:hypothetical protein DMENIID0001_045190 [Sergentomyia squamirostris]